VILEYRSNIGWDPVIREVVVRILDNAFRYCDGFVEFNLHKGRPRWIEHETVKAQVYPLLFDESGWPLQSPTSGEYWELLRAPEAVVLRYTTAIIDIAERLIADNTLLFNSLYHRCRIQRTEFTRTVPNCIIFKITGWEK
jgi:hypothetical protein